MQSRQHRQPGTASMHCNQSMCTDRPDCSGYKRRGVLREESRRALMKSLCTRCQGSTARKDGEGHTVAGAPVAPGLAHLPEIAHGDAKMPVDENMARGSTMLPKHPAVGLS